MPRADLAPGDSTWPPALLALMYHGIHDAPTDPGHFDPRYSVSSADFEAQMQRVRARCGEAFLPEAGDGGRGVAGAEYNSAIQAEYNSAIPTECNSAIHGECNSAIQGEIPGALPHAVMITFDDGDIADAAVALPILQRHGLRAVFFVTSEFVDQPGRVSSWQVRALAAAGMLIGSHGATHRFLSTLSDADLASELTQSRALLERVSGQRVDLLALPGGRGGERELRAARAAGFRHCFGSVPGLHHPHRASGYVERVAITRDLDRQAFDEICEWRGAAKQRLLWRHRLLAVPKKLVGDNAYDRLRQVLVR